jgi:hypothetical protein
MTDYCTLSSSIDTIQYVVSTSKVRVRQAARRVKLFILLISMLSSPTLCLSFKLRYSLHNEGPTFDPFTRVASTCGRFRCFSMDLFGVLRGSLSRLAYLGEWPASSRRPHEYDDRELPNYVSGRWLRFSRRRVFAGMLVR